MDQNIFKTAMHYYERGFSLIPVLCMDKKPQGGWAQFQRRKATPDELAFWFKDNVANIGIVTGSISGLSVIDLDDDNAIKFFSENNFPKSPMVRTERGYHIYYRYNLDIKTSVRVSDHKIDIRSDGGYVVAPPSINARGVRYEWVEGYRLDDLPLADFPMELLTPKGVHKNDIKIVELYSGVPEGQRNDTLTRLMGYWLKNKPKLDDCLAMAYAWNSRNNPPLSDTEVVKTVTGLYQRYGAQNTVPVTDETKQSTLVSLAALLNEPEEVFPWVIKDTLPLGGSSIVVAKPKVGKSTVIRQGMLNVARGELFLDRETTPGPVIYLALEEKRSEIRRHFRDMGATGGESIFVSTLINRNDPISELRHMIERVKAVWVVIDPLFKFIDVKDGNAYSEMSKAIEIIHNLAREMNIHITIIHHATKGNRSGGDGILGSTAIFGGIDTAIILKNDGANRTISSIQRYGVDIPESVLVFNKAARTTSLGASQSVAAAVSLEQDIVNFLLLQTQPVSEITINQNISGDSGVRSAALRNLVASGTVVRTGAGKKGSPYLYSQKPPATSILEESPFEAESSKVTCINGVSFDDMFKPLPPSENNGEGFDIMI